MIIHRDLKSNNILIDRRWTAKIADFGLSRMKSEASQISGMLGTPGWSAPEIYKQDKYNEKVDVYSYGVVLAELITSERPYAGLNGMQIAFATVYQGIRPQLPDSCSPALRTLIKSCWDGIPSKRPSWEKILTVLKKLEEVTPTERHGRKKSVPKLPRLRNSSKRDKGGALEAAEEVSSGDATPLSSAKDEDRPPRPRVRGTSPLDMYRDKNSTSINVGSADASRRSAVGSSRQGNARDRSGLVSPSSGTFRHPSPFRS